MSMPHKRGGGRVSAVCRMRFCGLVAVLVLFWSKRCATWNMGGLLMAEMTKVPFSG